MVGVGAVWMQLYSSGADSPQPSNTIKAMVLPLGSLGWSSSFQAELEAMSEVLRCDRKKAVQTDLRERSVFGEDQGAAFNKSQAWRWAHVMTNGPLVFHANIIFRGSEYSFVFLFCLFLLWLWIFCKE